MAPDVHIDLTSQLVLPANPRAVRNARTFVEECCHNAHVEEDACDTVALLTSETVTNAIVHGRSAAHLSVTVGRGMVLVEVWDDNSRLPEIVEQDDEALNGRGMLIVDSLAARWGTTEHLNGKTVWFEVPIEPAVQIPDPERASFAAH
jgi:anti-sigma regulatory factor (Ser/Thr protein kinase)